LADGGGGRGKCTRLHHVKRERECPGGENSGENMSGGYILGEMPGYGGGQYPFTVFRYRMWQLINMS